MTWTPHEQEDHTDEAAEMVRRLAGDAPRPLVIVAGSGLARLSEVLSVEHRLARRDIPHMPQPTVAGHPGEVVLGRLGHLGAILFCGRVHFYEGKSPHEVVACVRLAARLGGTILLATNAAGGLSHFLQPGDLMMLRGQVDLTFRNLPGARATQGPRTERARDGSPFDVHLCALLRQAARDAKINLKEGIYVGNVGPGYETRAEAAMLRTIGADAVGMSTVAEVAEARRLGLRVVAISCIANHVPAWGSGHTVAHAQVIEQVGRATAQLTRLIARWGEMMADDTNLRSDR